MSDNEARRATNRATLESIAALLKAGDWEGMGAYWATDGVMEVPYAAPGQAVTTGLPAIRENLAATRAMFSEWSTPEFTIFPTIDPDVFFAEYRSDATVKSNGKPYRNTYVGYFRLDDGRIVHWKEYFNPNVAREAFRP